MKLAMMYMLMNEEVAGSVLYIILMAYFSSSELYTDNPSSTRVQGSQSANTFFSGRIMTSMSPMFFGMWRRNVSFINRNYHTLRCSDDCQLATPV